MPSWDITQSWANRDNVNGNDYELAGAVFKLIAVAMQYYERRGLRILNYYHKKNQNINQSHTEKIK